MVKGNYHIMDVINGDSPNIWPDSATSLRGLGPGFRGIRPGGLQSQSGRAFSATQRGGTGRSRGWKNLGNPMGKMEKYMGKGGFYSF